MKLSDKWISLLPMICIGLAFLYGLIQIDLPPIDRHNWRQCLTLMITNNIFELNQSIFYPKYNLSGEGTGIIPTEFPILNYLTALCYELFGKQDWVARLVPFIFTCFGFYYFHRIVSKVLSKYGALCALLIIMASIITVYGRKHMPDSFALSLVMIGTYYLWEHLEKFKTWDLIIGFIFLTLGVLSKIPMISFASLLVIPLFNAKAFNRVLPFGIGCVVLSLCVGTWYFYWMPHLETTFGNKLIWPVSLQEGFSIMIEYWDKILFKRWFVSTFHNPVTSILGFLGVLLFFKNRAVFFALVGYFISILLFICKTGHTYHLHDYYMISIIPLLGIGAGKSLELLSKIAFISKKAYFKYVLIGLLVLPSMYTINDIIQERHDELLLSLKEIIGDQGIEKEDLVAVNGGSMLNPVMMYFTDRRGWSLYDKDISSGKFVGQLADVGLKYVILDKRRRIVDLPYQKTFENDDFIVYQVHPKSSGNESQ